MKTLRVALALISGLLMGVGIAVLAFEPWSTNRIIVGILTGSAVSASFIIPLKKVTWLGVWCIYVPIIVLLASNEISFYSNHRIELVIAWVLALFLAILGTQLLYVRHRENLNVR